MNLTTDMMNEYMEGGIDGWKGERRNGRMNPVSHPIILPTEEWTDEPLLVTLITPLGLLDRKGLLCGLHCGHVFDSI